MFKNEIRKTEQRDGWMGGWAVDVCLGIHVYLMGRVTVDVDLCSSRSESSDGL